MKILQNRIYVALFVSLAATVFLQAKDARAQGDGPLAYQLLPQGTKVVALWGLHTNGNQTADPGTVVQDGKIDVNLAILQYVHTFSLIKDQQAALFGVLPFGKLHGSMEWGHILNCELSNHNTVVCSLFGDERTPAEHIMKFIKRCTIRDKTPVSISQFKM